MNRKAAVQIPPIGVKFERLLHWRGAAAGEAPTTEDEQPLRAELFSVEQLQRHARTLATTDRLTTDRALPERLHARLKENEALLVGTHHLVTVAANRHRRIPPAAEWLLDNFYLIEEQIRLARRHLPKSFSRQLPRLTSGRAARQPRAYGIALELIAHGDGRIDAESLEAFLTAYQSMATLQLGELWALPSMLRLALIENLRRVAARVTAGRRAQDLADDWAEQMLQVVEQNPTDLVLVLADMARANPPLTGAFLAELTRRLQGGSPHFAFVTSWLEHRLSEQGLTIEQLVMAEGRAQAADQISMGNSISSLRFLSSNDWRVFVERQSLVHQILCGDPAGAFAASDFATRDRCRHAVEKIARRSALSETDVARRALQLTHTASAGSPHERMSHVGYYLLDAGRTRLETEVGLRVSLPIMAQRMGRRMALGLYLGGIAAITLTATAACLSACGRSGASTWSLALLLVPALFTASVLGVGFANWLSTLLVKTRPLPRLDFSQGIPPEHRTLVVVPTMLSSAAAIDELLQGLEVRYLANVDDHLHFALLTDFLDAPAETLPADAELLQLAATGVEQLCRKYAGERPDIFFLLHRPRRWNPHDAVWMGFERKRGKLADLNAFLRGATGRFSHLVGATSVLRDVRYVITLDTDTELPRDAARELVGTLAHPLNRPVWDAAQHRIVTGYGLLQPRVGVSLPGARRSWYVRLFAGESGIDPYTRVVSDVYQDLFGEGSFVGKGIYDVDAFEQSCGRFPENAILSHDLLESVHARSGLVSDVLLYENFPASYAADVSRKHRWMRGDWQIAWWLLPWVPRLAAPPCANPISILSFWKIFDNLRRSLVPIAMLALLLVGWFTVPPPWTAVLNLFVLAVVGTIPLLAFAQDLLLKPLDLPWGLHLRAVIAALGRHLAQWSATLTFLAYDAYVSLDAIGRTLVRVLVTRHKLLEWKTSSEAERGSGRNLTSFLRAMVFAPLVAVLTMLVLGIWQPTSLATAAPFLVLWLCSPVVAWWLSRELPPAAVRLTTGQRDFLAQVSRRTWRYFEDCVTAENHWLAPDNVQEKPARSVAARTSPTNIGVALLSDLAACDFGYCTVGRLIDRVQQTFATLARMDRYAGHFYNWYDTHTLSPLPPLYVSTVDSGNLAASLLVLRSGLLEQIDADVLPPRMLGGLRDTLRVVLTESREHHPHRPGRGLPLVPSQLLHKMERLSDELDVRPQSLHATLLILADLVPAARVIAGAAHATAELNWWAETFARACVEHRDDLAGLTGWLELLPAPATTWNSAVPAVQARLDTLRSLLPRLGQVPTLREQADWQIALLPLLDEILADLAADGAAGNADLSLQLTRLQQALGRANQTAAGRIQELEQLAEQCQSLAEMDVAFLFDAPRKLFAIGYNVSSCRRDEGHYDLLASEARVASFVAIAQGKVGQEHWFALSRLLTTTGGDPALLSWSGSMFEYLMPHLIMPNYENTLLDHTCRAVVRRQIAYGRQRGVPWGVSESGYNAIDVAQNYQYRAFGVPGLGLKRGLAEDLVIAPYATVLALMVAPEAACHNLERLAHDGYLGAYGFYESIDYTPARVPPGATEAVVRQFMAHHQGMSLLSLAWLLLDRPMQRRFSADAVLRAADLLLQERVPRACAPVFPHVSEADTTQLDSAENRRPMRVLTDPGRPLPEVNLLSNGRYHVMITSAGGGYSRWRDLAVTRWREDATRDDWGTFCYLRAVETGDVWSTAWQPTHQPASRPEVIFTQARAEFRRIDHRLETHTEISVSPEDDVELRRITLTNREDEPRTIEVTSYSEVVLTFTPHDQAHPAFSNLFVQTELVRNRQAILCTRRPRSSEERPPWLVHLMSVRGTAVGQASYETDRMRFIGRGRTLAAPAALAGGPDLSDSAGSVLDPVICIRHRIRLEPHETASIDFVTGVAETRAGATALLDKYHDPRLADRVFELAWTHSHILLRQLNVSEADAQAYARLAGSIIYATAQRRSPASILTRNRRGQSGLWGYGISGDWPIVLVRIRDRLRLDLVRQAVQAHAYWRLKGLTVDLVIWNEDDSVYRQSLQDTIMDIVAASPEASLVDKPGGVFVRRGEQMSEDDRILLQTVARVVLLDDAGSLVEQAERRISNDLPMPSLRPGRRLADLTPPRKVEDPNRNLLFFNGLGGFSPDGREYITILASGSTTPAPWVNVIANPEFGTVVSENGSAYTWSENCHEYRLTPWTNDPVTDIGGEHLYLRDEESGRFWSPTPAPAQGRNPYVIRHGFGYSIFESDEDGIATELCIYVATDAPVKFARLKIRNHSSRRRRLSVTGCWDWVLGELRSKTLLHVVTEVDQRTGALFAHNAYSLEFPGKVAFVDCSEVQRTVTSDRTEFFGRNGTPANPAALRRARLSGRVRAGFDPCAAMQVPCDLEEGQERDITFILGAGRDAEDARQLVKRFRGTSSAQQAQEAVWHYWSRTLGVAYCETPDPAVNVLVNGWLLYQILACRMWARTGFYQSGGAFGFRDQLQDAMSLVHAEPGLLREHLLRAAAHQFREGDVQHWWHPPAGRGVRTHFADDYLWLPYAVCRYVAVSGDTGVLDERVAYLNARPLPLEEDACYDLPQVSDETGTLYDHCLRAVNHGLRFGAHGLPLMGGGDWNDGMNLVGAGGTGESVWLAFFLYDLLEQFSPLARQRGDLAAADTFALEAGRLRGNIDLHAWDGQWYRRAYFDDGSPLGSSANPECRIDSLAQTWSVLSHAGSRERSRTAMNSVDRFLVRRDAGLIQLLEPPFDKSPLNPGYIKGYVPGVRENGGQYTHAAIWTVMAFAALGDNRRAWELFSLINPVRHSSTPAAAATYRVEPYVVAADVYGVAPHVGRGGWTWYTGSAGWMYRLITESLLGLHRKINSLYFTPCLPPEWPSCKIHYRYHETVYHITIHNGGDSRTVRRLSVDGVDSADLTVPLVDDRQEHQVDVCLEDRHNEAVSKLHSAVVAPD